VPDLRWARAVPRRAGKGGSLPPQAGAQPGPSCLPSALKDTTQRQKPDENKP